jgi:prolyl oligopeptidase
MPKTAQLDGANPILVTGYGGFGLSVTPVEVSWVRPLFDRGFLFAEANLRGGSEFGNEWHENGRLTRKQNVFDDFVWVLRHLIDRGYSSPDRIAIIGWSNGGLLMGAALTQAPDLLGSVVSFVGIYDMLRVELSPNGEFNVPEFGTVEQQVQFEALYAYSPYHNVRGGVTYPPSLLITGANDPRVDPMQSRKMTARLQAAQAGDEPILLRTDVATGHGFGTALDAVVEEMTDALAFTVDRVN